MAGPGPVKDTKLGRDSVRRSFAGLLYDLEPGSGYRIELFMKGDEITLRYTKETK